MRCVPCSRSRTMSTGPRTARPTRHVSPMITPFRLRIALIRCRVPSIPARLSGPNSPSARAAFSKSSRVISLSARVSALSRKRAYGFLPRSRTISRRLTRALASRRGVRMSSGSTCGGFKGSKEQARNARPKQGKQDVCPSIIIKRMHILECCSKPFGTATYLQE
jgi:hypothetical protein